MKLMPASLSYAARQTPINPFLGDALKGAEYDSREIGFRERPHAAGARTLAGYLPDDRGTILDVGSGTGISALEILMAKPQIRKVIGVDMSRGMKEVAEYKFSHSEGGEWLREAADPALQAYWKDFRKMSYPYARRAEFMQANLEEPLSMQDGIIDSALANYSMQWMDIPKALRQLRRVLVPDGTVVWNLGSHVFEDAAYPSADYDFRHNSFLTKAIDAMRRKGIEMNGQESLVKPRYNFDAIQKLTASVGFQTTQRTRSLTPIDWKIFVKEDVPRFARRLAGHGSMDADGKAQVDKAIKEATLQTLKARGALVDKQHAYCVTPVLVSTKV